MVELWLVISCYDVYADKMITHQNWEGAFPCLVMWISFSMASHVFFTCNTFS